MKKNVNDLNLVGHLDELRTRLIRTLIAFLVSMAAAFLYVRQIYGWL
ncbi:twin-arginine translocase subunit TatC, partial [Paenibacillus darwinianus]